MVHATHLQRRLAAFAIADEGQALRRPRDAAYMAASYRLAGLPE